MKKHRNDWYQRNFWWIFTIALLVLAVIFISAAILVNPFFSIGLVVVTFGFYIVFQVRNLTKARIEKLRKSLPPGTTCSKCGKEIKTESPDVEPKTINDKPACDDCWAEAVGDEIEKHPIMSPRKLLSKKTEQSS